MRRVLFSTEEQAGLETKGEEMRHREPVRAKDIEERVEKRLEAERECVLWRVEKHRRGVNDSWTPASIANI